METHILVVEDDAEIREGVAIYLKNQGYTVHGAANGAQGLELARQLPIHLAVVDVMMPVMDGAEACYPLYAAAAKAVYQDIAHIESNWADSGERAWTNGKIVTFTNTVVGFERLIEGNVDLFFGARPSADQLAYAAEQGVELEITPIGREAFVFFVEEDEPVDGLTQDQLRAIYHGDVTDWSQVGGRAGEIAAFQRPAGSGSQTMRRWAPWRGSSATWPSMPTSGGHWATPSGILSRASARRRGSSCWRWTG